MCNKKCAYFITVLLAVGLAASLSAAATSPIPKDGTTDVLRDGTILKWSSDAAKFDVYFGSNLQYVTQVERTAPVYVYASLGQTTMTFDPGRLELGKTYYWRVDEVDESDPNEVKVTRGDVWSFMVETPVQQVVPIAATTSCSIYENMGPEKTIDGSGLVAGLHSASMEDMWLSCSPAPEQVDPNSFVGQPLDPNDPNSPVVGEPIDPNDPNSPVVAAPVVMVTPEVWIQYEFDRIQKFQEMHVWNWNSAAEQYFGLGVKEATILVSNDGVEWTPLGDFEFAAAPGASGYAYNTVIDFQGTAAKFVRLVMKSSQKGANEYGLSEVQFFSYPVYAREPSPAPGKTGMALDATVSWRSGRDAGSHQVYISTDKSAVANGSAPVFTVSTNSFKLSSTELKLSSTYYWRVDEVNDAGNPTSFAGDIWSFSTVDYLVMDNFESYTDNLSSVWGSAVHASLGLEKSTIHSGKQSLVINYNNSGNDFDTWVSLTGSNKVQKNWTKNGIKSLVLFVHGTSANQTVPIRPRINEIAVTRNSVANGNWWSIWSIDSAQFTNVGSITMTFTIPGNSQGKLYLDDLRLYAQVPALTIVDQVLTLNASGAAKGQLDTLIAAVSTDATLLDLLSGDKTYTLFAPTDDAFATAGINEKSDKAVLGDVLRNNIVAAKLSVESVGTVKTLEGSSLIQDANTVTDEIGGQAIVAAGADASNGTVLLSSAVLMPYQNVKLMDLLTAMNTDGDLAGQFDTLLAAIGAAKATVRDTLGKRSYTLFAPTDDAFAALGYDPDTIATIDQGVLTDVLLYHLASGRIMGKDLTDKITTVQGGVLKQSKGVLTDAIGGKAKITGYDVEGSNGVIHIVDGVLMPFTKTKLLDLVALVNALNASGDLAGQFSTLIAIAEGADAAQVAPLLQAGEYTVFAPTDAGFAAVGIDVASLEGQTQAFLTDLLLYHIVSGAVTAADALAATEITTLQGGVITLDPNDPNQPLTGAFAGKASITAADIVASNGLIQVIDSGLLPYEIPAIVVPEEPNVVPEAPVLVSIIDTVIALNAAGDHAGQFDTFLAAVEAANPIVLETLAGTDDYTLFVPTDDACAALGLTPENVGTQDKLVITDVLLYHIAPGKLLAADIQAVESIPMVKGGAVQQADGVLTDNTGGQAKIVGQDIEASNGMIQIIDAVLLPAKL
jgi:transforming growth factor-beta-induced protein